MTDSPEPVDPDELSATLQHRIADALGDAMLIKYAAVMEVVEPSGERVLMVAASPDCKAWESLGMLTFALETERAQMIADTLGS